MNGMGLSTDAGQQHGSTPRRICLAISAQHQITRVLGYLSARIFGISAGIVWRLSGSGTRHCADVSRISGRDIGYTTARSFGKNSRSSSTKHLHGHSQPIANIPEGVPAHIATTTTAA